MHNAICYDTTVNDLETNSGCAHGWMCFAALRPKNGARAMSTDNDWWSWIVIGTLFLLTTPVVYVPVGRVLGFF